MIYQLDVTKTRTLKDYTSNGVMYLTFKFVVIKHLLNSSKAQKKIFDTLMNTITFVLFSEKKTASFMQMSRCMSGDASQCIPH